MFAFFVLYYLQGRVACGRRNGLEKSLAPTQNIFPTVTLHYFHAWMHKKCYKHHITFFCVYKMCETFFTRLRVETAKHATYTAPHTLPLTPITATKKFAKK